MEANMSNPNSHRNSHLAASSRSQRPLDHIHIELPRGAMVSVSPDISPEGISALNNMMEAIAKCVTKAFHEERITCPACGVEQVAKVEHTSPWWTYVHFCNCGHVITESEWEKSEGSR